MSKELDKLLQEMNKKFGEEGTIKEFGEGVANVEAIPTGIPSLDLITGVGGFPRGRIIELYGPEGSGKTTVALRAMAEAQRLAGQLPRMTYQADPSTVKKITGRVGMLDVEHALSPSLVEIQGVKTGAGSGFFFDQPTGGDEALNKLSMMVQSNLFDIIVVDSVAGLTTLEERNNEAGDNTMATTARLMSAELKKLTSLINMSRTIVIFTNQIREKPAVIYGNPETTPGGRALKFYSSMRIRVARGESINEGTNRVGHRMKLTINKNKVAPPFQSTEVDLYYVDAKGKKAGFDIHSDFINTARGMGIVELRGSQYRYVDRETGEIFKANGKVAFEKLLEEKPEIHTMIMNEVLGVNYNDSEQTE